MRLLQVISGGKLPRKPPSLPSFGLIPGCYLILCSILLAADPEKPVRAPPTTRANLKQYESAAYVIYTDVSADDAREAVPRMARMADEYRDRTKPLFAGMVNGRLPFYLFANAKDYHAASHRTDSAGVFTGDALMAMVQPGPKGGMDALTWRIVQHEGFHQYVDAAGHGDIPTWMNEGLAEYFGESLFTGDGMVSGIIPAEKLRNIQTGIRRGDFISIRDMVNLSHEKWNAKLEYANYDQAWSMVYFLMHGENGKYQDVFARLIASSDDHKDLEPIWTGTFGGVEGFETKWKDYWRKMPENPTLERYAEATVKTFASFLGRAHSQGQKFESFDAFVKMNPSDLNAAPEDRLPPSLSVRMRELCEQLKKEGVTFRLIADGNAPPQILCVMPRGGRLVGTFMVKDGRVMKVVVERRR